MDTDSSDQTATGPSVPGETDRPPADSPDSADTPVTATGERSTTIEEDKAGGVLPTPEPTDGGAPAP